MNRRGLLGTLLGLPAVLLSRLLPDVLGGITHWAELPTVPTQEGYYSPNGGYYINCTAEPGDACLAKRLNVTQCSFCAACAKDFHSTRAATAAGYGVRHNK